MSKFTEYFSLEGTLARCRNCKHTVSYKDYNTKSMSIHLKTHKDLWEEFSKKEQSKAQKRQAEQEKMSQGMKKFVVSQSYPPDNGSCTSPSSAQSVDRSQPAVDKVYGNWSQHGQRTKKAHRALVQLIAGANLPLSLVELELVELVDKLKQYAVEEAAKILRASSPDTTDSEDNDAPVDALSQLLALAGPGQVGIIPARGPSGSVDARQKANVEVETYLTAKTLKGKDPYAYWEEEQEKLPVLHALFLRFLSAPSTSAESERLFSLGTAIYTHLRRSMTSKTLQNLLFISRNLPIYGF